MSEISITREHSLGRDGARGVAEKMASDLQERFQLTWHWQDDVLHFDRTGVNGTLTVDEKQLHILVKLGFLMMPLKGMLEQSINKELDDLLA